MKYRIFGQAVEINRSGGNHKFMELRNNRS